MDKEKEDELKIERAFNDLLSEYMKSNHRKKVEIIKKAFTLANEAHKGARRLSGEPYIMHPIAVAQIVCSEIGLGSTSICAALLHDVVEDTDYTVDDIKMLFGDKVAEIVAGLTKISRGKLKNAKSAQAENYRKLLLTMADDIRVILVKIADRLHNMRTLSAMQPAKRYKIAGETEFIYAPIAHRLGLFDIKTELEELSFMYENPAKYEEIKKKLEDTKERRKKIFENFAGPVKDKLNEMGLRYEILARDKSVFSIWKKMSIKSIPFEEVYDLFAVRIVFESEAGVDEKKRCWDIYSAITDIYKLRPDRIRDWVSRPKSNGYQALHLTVMGPDGEWIEIQIRSRRMNQVAEKGLAAHWKYKEGKIEENPELEKWMERIQEILENPSPNGVDFLDSIKLNLYAQEIFVFTPKGEIKTMPLNSTALDFAYELHSNIGDHCIGAKVNHELVPLSYKLNSGDQVEVLTSKTQVPQYEWLGFITTTKAKTKLDAALKKLKKEGAKTGEVMLKELLAVDEIPIPFIDKLLDYYKIERKEDLLFAIGNKAIALPEKPEKFFSDKSGTGLMGFMKQAFRIGKKNGVKNVISDSEPDTESYDTKKTYIVQEDFLKKNFRIATCCRPVPGDVIFGFIMDNSHVMIHEINCPKAAQIKAGYGDRILELKWGNFTQSLFLATIRVEGMDRIGLLNDMTTIITQEQVNIKNINVTTDDGIFRGEMVFYVHNVTEIGKLIAKIEKIGGVKKTARFMY